jgi:hypothetical protein
MRWRGWAAGRWGIIEKRRDQLTMGYFDNLDNKSLNKYKKMGKKYRCVLLPLD